MFEYALEDEYSHTIDANPIEYYVPGHLPKKINEYRKRMKTLSCTFLTFSPNGQELLVNLGGEQLYIFDAKIGSQNPSRMHFKYNSFRQMLNKSEKTNTDASSSSSSNEGLAGAAVESTASSKPSLMSSIFHLKNLSNEAEQEKILSASLPNEKIERVSKSSFK